MRKVQKSQCSAAENISAAAVERTIVVDDGDAIVEVAVAMTQSTRVRVEAR